MKAPFPWFGGKSRVAHIVWDRFGDVRNYVEPFAGSLAVLLARPTDAKIETVNDLDCLIANFWRAVTAAPVDVAHWADAPVNEADLHARHLWLVKRVHTPNWRERMMTDPDFYDAKVAGWWVWGISQWIGSGWCAAPGTKVRMSDGFLRSMQRADGTPQRGRPCLQEGQGINAAVLAATTHAGPGQMSTNAGRAARGIHAEGLITPGRGAAGKGSPRGIQTVTNKRPNLTNHGGGVGVHSQKNRQSPPGDPWQKRPRLDRGGRGVLATKRQVPDISGECGAAGRGVHASGIELESGLYAWFLELAARLRRVRVCCGDWKRILGPAPTTCIGLTGVFLDPPYAVDDRSDVYGEESRDVAHEVRAWAIEHGDDPKLRIALCGYQGEHTMPASWKELRWKAGGGYGNQKPAFDASGARLKSRGRANAERERIWFSPHCIAQQQADLFSAEDRDSVVSCAMTET